MINKSTRLPKGSLPFGYKLLHNLTDGQIMEQSGSPSWTRTNDPAVNSRMLYQLSY